MPLIISLPCSVFWVTLSLPLMSQPFFMISVSDSFPCFPWKNFHFSRSALPDALILNDSLTFPLSYPAECGGKIESCRDFMKNKYKFTKSGLESQGTRHQAIPSLLLAFVYHLPCAKARRAIFSVDWDTWKTIMCGLFAHIVTPALSQCRWHINKVQQETLQTE